MRCVIDLYLTFLFLLLHFVVCTESSRVPEFIYKSCEQSNKHCKIIIAQPRRIAALNLWNRLKSSLGEEAVGLKMGGGVKHGAIDSKITFVTT